MMWGTDTHIVAVLLQAVLLQQVFPGLLLVCRQSAKVLVWTSPTQYCTPCSLGHRRQCRAAGVLSAHVQIDLLHLVSSSSLSCQTPAALPPAIQSTHPAWATSPTCTNIADRGSSTILRTPLLHGHDVSITNIINFDTGWSTCGRVTGGRYAVCCSPAEDLAVAEVVAGVGRARIVGEPDHALRQQIRIHHLQQYIVRALGAGKPAPECLAESDVTGAVRRRTAAMSRMPHDDFCPSTR